MMSLVRSFILMVLFATNGAAQTSPLDLLLQQQSQGLPFGTDMQSLEDIFSGQGFDINPENEARTAKEPVIPSEQNVKLLDRRLTAEEAQQRRQQGQALSNDLLGGQSKTQMPSMVETYYKILTGESLDVFGTGKSATSNNIADDPADELLFFNSLGSDYRLAAGDVLAISIRGLSSTDEEAIVDGEGKIAIPGMLPVIAAGRSIADVQSDIKQVLEVDDASANVYVSLSAARLVSVQITGAIGQPGTVAVPAYTPVSRILPLVGDILPQGSARNITLFQNGDRQIIDLYQSLLGLDAAVDPLVVNNARLHVGDQGGTVAVAGFVGRSGIFELAAGQTAISTDELFRLANIRLMAPGTKMDLLRFNDQGVPTSEPIAFGKDQMVQAGQALQIQFVQTRSQSDVKVFGAVEKSFSLNIVNPIPIAELLRNGAALTSDVYMDFALIAGNRSENGADRTINLTKALRFPDRFLIQPGETLIILNLNQYQTLLRQSLTEPSGRISQLLVSAEPAEVFLDGRRVAFVAASGGQTIADIFGTQLSFPQDIDYDFSLLFDTKAVAQKPKAFLLSEALTEASGYDLRRGARLQLFTTTFLRNVNLPNLKNFSVDQTVLESAPGTQNKTAREGIASSTSMSLANQSNASAGQVQGAELDSQIAFETQSQLDMGGELAVAARGISASAPTVIFVNGQQYGFLPSDVRFSNTRLARELTRTAEIYPLYAEVATQAPDGYSFETGSFALGALASRQSTFSTQASMRLDFYTQEFIRRFVLPNNPVKTTEDLSKAVETLRAAGRFISGAIRQPGQYPVAADLSLDLFLRVAGGALPNADLKNVILRTYVVSRNGEIDLQRSKRIDLTAVSPASIKLSGNYDILIPALVNNAVSGVVALNGQVQRPGNYTVGRDETLHDIIERAGGFTEVAYPLGAVLTRQSLKEEQTRANLSLARQVEQSILSLSQNASAEQSQQIPAVIGLANQLRTLSGSGRQIVNAALKSGENPVFLEDGDSLFIPKRPSHVSVIGSVYNEVSAVYAPYKTPRNYISEAGGTSKIADSKNVYMVLPNGQSEPIGEIDSANVIIPPGAVLIVPPKVDKLSPLGLSRVVSDILSNIATSVLAINAVR
ncbi:MAG: SLBB domain-containing protein [Paracoccaceae bacterium]|nr:SLBB domain-containing protein [Paracoccaceae bacterium]